MAPNQKKRWWMLAGIIGAMLALSLGCYSSDGPVVDMATFSGNAVPPWWVCVPVTPEPTATPQPAPPDWPPTAVPTSTPLPGVPSPTPTPFGWPPPTSTPVSVWQPPNWPPTPAPTPTPYVITGGEFYLNQNVWVPISNVPGAHEWYGVSVKEWSPRLSPTNPAERCIHLSIKVTSFAAAPIDIDVPALAFLSSEHTQDVYFARLEDYQAFGLDYPETRFAPGESHTMIVPICHTGWPGTSSMPETEHVRLGFVTSAFESRAGAVGMDAAPTGSDVAMWVNFWSPAPGCSYPPEQGRYPEFSDPPLGVANPIAGVLVRDMGGRYASGTPVTIPPCLYITRGFGCSGFPTGVSGAWRCPAEAPYWHTGIDYSCYEGTPIYNVLNGYVRRWGDGGGYGNLVVVGNQANTMSVYYAHLHHFAAPQEGCFADGQIGDACADGYPVGGVGTTGFSTGNHLHWEVRVNNVPVDPFLYFGTARETVPASGILAALAAQPVAAAPDTDTPTFEHPLTLRVRDAHGTPLSDVTLHLFDIDGELLTSCVTANGRCEFSLPRGVYSVEMDGTLPDGTPIHPLGEANVEVQQGGQAEYHYGPLSIWHEAPSTQAGIVLIDDGTQMQPFLDATAHEAVPTALDPREYIETEAPQSMATPAMWPTHADGAASAADEAASRSPWVGALGVLVVFGLFAGCMYLAAYLRRSRTADKKGE